MSIFARPHYTSDTTDFLNQLKQAKPELEAQQLAGRSLLWDKEVHYEAQAQAAKANVPQKPYVYQTNN